MLSTRIGKVGASPLSLTGQPNAMGGREVGAFDPVSTRCGSGCTSGSSQGANRSGADLLSLVEPGAA